MPRDIDFDLLNTTLDEAVEGARYDLSKGSPPIDVVTLTASLYRTTPERSAQLLGAALVRLAGAS